MKPDQERKAKPEQAQSKSIAENIPQIILLELPEHLRVKNCKPSDFKNKIAGKFSENQFQNENTKANILVRKSTFKHSLSNIFPSNPDFPRACLMNIDKVIKNAVRVIEKAPDKHGDENVNHVDIYAIWVKVDKNKNISMLTVKNMIGGGIIYIKFSVMFFMIN